MLELELAGFINSGGGRGRPYQPRQHHVRRETRRETPCESPCLSTASRQSAAPAWRVHSLGFWLLRRRPKQNTSSIELLGPRSQIRCLRPRPFDPLAIVVGYLPPSGRSSSDRSIAAKMVLSRSLPWMLVLVFVMALMCTVRAAPAPWPAPEPAPGPAPAPNPIWRLFGFGGYNSGPRGGRAYNGPPPEGPNEYKAICRSNNPDNFAFGPGNIPSGPVCPW